MLATIEHVSSHWVTMRLEAGLVGRFTPHEGWNRASVRSRRLPRTRAAGSRAADRLLRGRRPKKLHVGRRRHGRHGRLVVALRRGRRRAVFSPRLGMSMLLFGMVHFLVLPLLLPEHLFVYSGLAVDAEGRGSLEFAAVAPHGALRLLGALPPPRERQRVF